MGLINSNLMIDRLKAWFNEVYNEKDEGYASELYEKKGTLEALECCMAEIASAPEADAAKIAKLCNEIDDAISSIDKMNPNLTIHYELGFIKDKLDEIRNELVKAAKSSE